MMRSHPSLRTGRFPSSISSGRSCGYPVPEAAELDGDEWDTMVEFFETVAGYLRSALEDEETRALIDPDGESAVDGAFFERAARAAREVELFSERS